MHQAVSWKTALSIKKYNQQSHPLFPFNSALNAITQGNGVWVWELLDSCQKEREREGTGRECLVFLSLFFLIKPLSSAVCILSQLLHLLDWIILHFDWNDVHAR